MSVDQQSSIPDDITIRDLYVLLTETRDEFKTSMKAIQEQVTALNISMDNLGSRVETCESRIATLEDDMDGKLTDHEKALTDLMAQQDDFPVETTLVCAGLSESNDENIHDKAQDLVENGLGLTHVNVIRAKRLVSHNNKPGLVKICLPSLDHKIKALRCKYNLADTGYDAVFIRSSMSHSDRLMQQNFQALLKEIPNGDGYRMTVNGKLVKKDVPDLMGTWARGPPVSESHGYRGGMGRGSWRGGGKRGGYGAERARGSGNRGGYGGERARGGSCCCLLEFNVSLSQ